MAQTQRAVCGRELLQILILIPREQLVAVNYIETIKGEWELATFNQKKNE